MSFDNGNILDGYHIPDEILITVFQNLPDDILIKVIPHVCSHWHTLSRSWHIWKVRLKYNDIEVSKQRLERILSHWDDFRVISSVQWLCLFNNRQHAFNNNLLKNPSGIDHWVIHHGGDGIITEEPPVDCDPIPAEAKLPTQHCFVSSYEICKRTQSISLCRDYGIQPFLEVLQPSLLISEWVSASFDCGAESTTEVVVVGSNNRPAIFVEHWKDSDYGRVGWHHIHRKVNFEELPEEINTIRFENKSKGTQFYAGHCGAKTAGSSVILDIAED